MRNLTELPGAVELPDKYFYRVTKNSAGMVVQVRQKKLIGSFEVAQSYVLNDRFGLPELEYAVKRAYKAFLDATTNLLDDYYGDYQ